MGISCRLGRHEVVTRGVGNGAYEFGRCLRCACDLMRSGSDWKRLPKGYKIVWKPKDSARAVAVDHRAAAIGREVDLRAVTVVSEQCYGSQRFALVVLNAKDRRDYGAMVDAFGTDGINGRMMQKRYAYSSRGLLKPREAAPQPRDLMTTSEPDSFGWEEPSLPSIGEFAPAGERTGRGTNSAAAAGRQRPQEHALRRIAGRRAA